MPSPRSFTRTLTTGGCGPLCLAAGAAAQASEENHPVTVRGAGGFTGVVGQDAGRLDHGGSFQLGAGDFFYDYLGITANLSFNDLGITGRELERLNLPDGDARVYSLTFDPVLRLPIRKQWSVHVGGGLNIPLPNTSLRGFIERRYLHGFTGISGTSVVTSLFGIRG